MHTCRKWRRIVVASQRVLRLRLFCTHGTPVQKSLDCWPSLPIVVQYGGLPALSPPAPEDEDNIVAALKRSDRVISISLTVTISLMEKLSAIKKPFSELQDLVLLSQDGAPLTLPRTFRCGQRLRRLHSTGIAFPALMQPLYPSSSTNLIDLQLHDAFLPWQISTVILPVILKDVLSEMTKLRSLSLHFCSAVDYHFPLTPYGERIVLPFLTSLNYRGSVAYLEGIFAILDAPSLKDIEITFDNPFLALPKFKKFIDRIEMHRSHCEAFLLPSEPIVLMSSKSSGAFMRLLLQSLGKPSLMQISSMAQICVDLAPFLWNDEGYICISTTRPSEWIDRSCSGELLGHLNPFTGEKSIHLRLNRNHWTNIVHTSHLSQHGNVLPPIEKLFIPQPGPRHAFLRDAVVSVMVSYRLSGHPIEVEYERPYDINKQGETGTVYDHWPV